MITRLAIRLLPLLWMPAVAWSAPDLRAMTERYCTECHNTEDWAGGLDLTGLDHAQPAEHAAEWEKILIKLRAGMMPPPGSQRASQQETAAVIQALEQQLDAVADIHAAPPALHRLNRREYANAVRDVLGLEVDVSGMLPPEDASEGFDNIAAGLGISPALIQGYVGAAMKLARLAVGDLTTPESVTTYQTPAMQRQDQRIEGLPLGSRGGMRVVHYFPLDAEYRFSVRMSFAFGEFMMRGSDRQVDLALDGQRIEALGRREIRVPVKAGHHVITASVFDGGRSPGANGIYSGTGSQSVIETLEITGPFNATGPGETASRQRVFSCRPTSPAQEKLCAEQIIVDLASRAFRAPQRIKDLAVVTGFYERGYAEGGFEAGIQQALSRILIDPRFLFRFEDQPADHAPGSRWAISDLELASRLSFFLWSSIPDQPLINDAVAGRLRQPDVLATQVRRMLADPRSAALVENFAGQWLFLRELESVSPEVDGFDESLRQAFIGETRALVSWILAQDRPVTELLSADYSFLNERLARHYGIDGVRGAQLRKVNLPPETRRRGLLGHGSILTVTSTATRTSPVIRGAWILGNILGAPPPEPPPGVETNLDGDASSAVLAATVRERLEAHRENPSCGSCHGVIDPVGFALENFDAIGAWRERDGEAPVDASGTLVDGTRINGPEDLVTALQARSDLFVGNVAQKLLTYALGRPVEYRDMPTVRAIVRQAAQDDFRISALIMAVVQSPAFREREHIAESPQMAAR